MFGMPTFAAQVNHSGFNTGVFQIDISQNAKCALKDSFCKSSHKYVYVHLSVFLQVEK